LPDLVERATLEIVDDFDRGLWSNSADTPHELGGDQYNRRHERQSVIVTKNRGPRRQFLLSTHQRRHRLTLTTPANATGPVPVMMEFDSTLVDGRGRQGRPGWRSRCNW
jgi:hypothetical protein